MRDRRGAALLMVLFLLLVMVVLGMAFLGKQALNYRSSTQSALSQQALGLAWSGLERCRARLNKDASFPPRLAEDQLYFSYTEVLYDLDGVTPLGDCTVTIDRRWQTPPTSILEITSEARLKRGTEILAIRALRAELDVATTSRTAFNTDNPTLWRYLNWTDMGSL